MRSVAIHGTHAKPGTPMSNLLRRLLQFDVAILGLLTAGSLIGALYAIATNRPSLAGLGVAIAIYVGAEFARELRPPRERR